MHENSTEICCGYQDARKKQLYKIDCKYSIQQYCHIIATVTCKSQQTGSYIL